MTPMFQTDDNRNHFGWFLPDVTDLASIPHELYCLGINVEPIEDRAKEDLEEVYAIRGLALQPIIHVNQENVSSERIQDDSIPSFRRVGYFELESTGRGIFYPFESFGPDVKRVPPNTDPAGLFADCGPRTIRLF